MPDELLQGQYGSMEVPCQLRFREMALVLYSVRCLVDRLILGKTPMGMYAFM